MVVNAATRDKDLAWLTTRAAGSAVELNQRADLAMIAVQGPNARAKAAPLLPEAMGERAGKLKVFSSTAASAVRAIAARTVLRLCARAMRLPLSGRRWRMRGWRPAGWERETRCGLRPE